MSCAYHIGNQIQLICLAPHKCKFQRKLCGECLFEHEVDVKLYIAPIKKFQELVTQKLELSKPNNELELTAQILNFKTILSSTQNMLKQIWDQLTESIKQIFDMIEMEDKSYQKIISNNVNPTELSNTDLEKLVQIVEGKSLDFWKEKKNSYLKRLEFTKACLDQETRAFCERLNKERKSIMQLITMVGNSQENTQSITLIEQVYKRKKDLYEVLIQTKNIDGSFLNEIIAMLKKEKITNCLEFFSKQIKDQTQLKFIANVILNINEIDFNKKNYSLKENEQISKNVMKKNIFRKTNH
ncbi:unnamed protein product (macronuclear) [Paramecium tetraurelia]|uniref:Uncharacterized protein n=1 Tax=Paramecium tetraurelia TaxID=5888 RepID=A0EB02_PARTE|nr:uncharacterized protein GSPATT00025203001 [Paramecium tetraurelia]CAK92469.1 unnamed protein product [Paramecium tetraurelia]|eukprot:XP_001459866.1 hypothetical protein (macronuclear) [Paramecium tetraurelia strain d4-2]